MGGVGGWAVVRDCAFAVGLLHTMTSQKQHSHQWAWLTGAK